MNGHNWRLPVTGLRFLLSVLLVMGIFFRFVNIDRKFYWFDETFTSLRVSGYLGKSVKEEIFNGPVISSKDFLKYQSINDQKNEIDTIKGLAIEEGQLPPFYFLVARFWAKLFGTSVTAMRSLPALISVLLLPCAYWICLELFESSMVGWVAMALVSVSPMHVLYAQEARPYCFWTVLTLLSSAVLLRAMRLQTKLLWGIYTAITVVGIYTHLYTVLVLIAHGIYVFAMEKVRVTKTVIYYILAFFVSFISGLLWYLTLKYWQPPSSSSALSVMRPESRMPLMPIIKRWIGNISRIVFDVNLDAVSSFKKTLPLIPVIVFVLILLAYSIYFVCRHTSKPVYGFILTLIVFTSLPLMLGDLILGGRRLSGYARYLLPTYLGLQLAVAYLLTAKITSTSVNTWQQKFWKLVAIGVFSAGVLSCTLSAQAETWWNKGLDQGKFAIPIAHILNQADSPLLITDSTFGEVIPLIRLLDPKVDILWGDTLQIPNGNRNLFVFLPSKKLQERLKKQYNYNLKPVFLTSEVSYETRLWQLTHK
ncbi:glycosyltransferase family 39 protein [Microcoleus sp. D2_18a_D3]|uniref:glycosyltransferase family 39 protein n=1 Tax=Microcoleus sp. D2_18a_D3 TaxID=3055330 RepID=UPI002FCF4BE1